MADAEDLKSFTLTGIPVRVREGLLTIQLQGLGQLRGLGQKQGLGQLQGLGQKQVLGLGQLQGQLQGLVLVQVQFRL